MSKAVPHEDRCENCKFEHFSRYRCYNRAKHTVLVWPAQDFRTHELSGEPVEIRVCGVCKRSLDRGGTCHVFVAEKPSMFEDIVTRMMYTKENDENALKRKIQHAEWDDKSAKSNIHYTKNAVGRDLVDRIDTLIEFVAMVAERGDRDAMALYDKLKAGKAKLEDAEDAAKKSQAHLTNLNQQLEDLKNS